MQSFTKHEEIEILKDYIDTTCVNIKVIDDIRTLVFPALKTWKE